jgi:hypothetical protein
MNLEKTKSHYFDDAARPLTSLAYVIPILAIYELGVLWLGPLAMRNGADVWLRRLLDQIGFGQYFLLPLLTCGLLLGWHHVRREHWRVSPDTMGKMLTETTVFALALMALGYFQMTLVARFSVPLANAPAECAATGGGTTLVVGYMGAGVYEEVLFRLLVIPAVAKFLQYVGEPKSVSLTGAATVSSLLFAAAHYQVFTGCGEPFDVATFGFRFVAGLVFAAIFIFRGFGIAAGAHTLYDILVGTMTA